MNQNVRFIGLLLVVVAVLGGMWYVIRGGKPSAPADSGAPVAQKAEADDRRTGVDAPDISTSRKPSNFATTSGTNTRPRDTRKSAKTGNSAVRGQVLLEENQLPVAGAEILFFWRDVNSTSIAYDKDAQWTATSDDKGFFRVDKLPSGSFTVIAHHENLAAVSGASLNPREPEDTVVELYLRPMSTITGRVVNELQEPIAGALVLLGEGKLDGQELYGGNTQAASDADGQFTLNYVPKGIWTLSSKAEGYAVGEKIDVPHDGTGVQLVLKKGGKASGVVMSADSSSPQGNVKLTLYGSGRLNNFEALSDSEGKFAFADLADGSYNLQVQRQPYTLIGQPPIISIADANTVDDVKITVALGGSITGVATDAETGAPIVGMAFRARSPQGGSTGGQAETDEDGVYRIEGLQTGNYIVRRMWMAGYRHGESREDKPASVTLGKETSGIDFAVPPGLYLRGRVVDKNGEPLAQVQVESVDAENLEGETMVTDEKGRFVHRGFSPGAKLTVTASKMGYSAPPLTNVVMGDADKNDIEIVMDTGGSIAGIVVDKTGKPLVDANIVAMPQGDSQGMPAQQAMSRAGGEFKVQGLGPGSYKLRATPPRVWRDVPASGETIQLSQGEHLTGVRLVCDFDPGTKLAGRVIDSSGKPIRDASVNVHMRSGNSNGYSQTDAEGRFEIIGLQAGPHYYNVYHQEYSQSGRQEEVTVPNPNFTITLRGKGTVQGRVLEARSGQPVKNFSITALAGEVGRIDPAGFYGTGQAFVDEEGRFEIRANDGAASLYVMAQGYAPKLHKLSDIREGQTTQGVEVRLDAGGTIDGIVTDKQGQPVAGASVYLGHVPSQQWERQQRGPNATSDADGTFLIESLGAEETRIFAVKEGFAAASATVSPPSGGTSTIKLVLGSGGFIEGTINVGGRPATSGYGVSLNMMNEEGSGRGYSAQADLDGNGKFIFSGLPEGKAHLTVYGNQPTSTRRNISKTVTIVADQVTTVEFDISEGNAGIEGIIAREGQPVPNASVNLMIWTDEENTEQAHVQADSSGAYKFEGLPAGNATLIVHVFEQGQPNQQRSFQVVLQDREMTRHDVELSGGSKLVGRISGIPDGWFASVVIFRGNIDVSGDMQEVYLENQSLMAGSAVASPEGAFQIDGVETGSYTVLAVAGDPQSGGQTYKRGSQMVAVEADGEVNIDIKVE